MRIAKPVLILLAGAAVVPLAACKVDNRPLLAQMRGEPPPAQAALPQPGGPYEAAPGYGYGYGYNQPPPPPGYRPGPRRIAYQPARAWPYAERVYALDSAFYDLPPDYGFYYGDEQPWVWETSYDDLMFAEPWGDDYRFYYYEPGAAWPYFVADPYYGYAFGSDGALIALFTAAGVLLAEDDYPRYWPTAEQYWTRGLDLRQAYVSAPRYSVTQAIWTQRAPLITRTQTSWIRAGQSQPAWRDWRTRSGQDFVQRYAPERQRRVAMLQAPRNGGAPMTRGLQGGPQREMAQARGPGRMRGAPQMGFQAQPRFQGPHERGPARLAEARPHGRRETAFAAPQAGRPAVFRGAEAHGGGRRGGPPQERFAAASPQVQFHGGGGRHGGGPQERFAAASPQVQSHGGGGRHGDGGGGPPAQAYAQAQPQAPQQPHGNPRQGGGGPGGGQAGGGQGGGGHGQAKGDHQDHGHGRGR